MHWTTSRAIWAPLSLNILWALDPSKPVPLCIFWNWKMSKWQLQMPKTGRGRAHSCFTTFLRKIGILERERQCNGSKLIWTKYFCYLIWYDAVALHSSVNQGSDIRLFYSLRLSNSKFKRQSEYNSFFMLKTLAHISRVREIIY